MGERHDLLSLSKVSNFALVQSAIPVVYLITEIAQLLIALTVFPLLSLDFNFLHTSDVFIPNLYLRMSMLDVVSLNVVQIFIVIFFIRTLNVTSTKHLDFLSFY